jgi:uncharacterized membrane protein
LGNSSYGEAGALAAILIVFVLVWLLFAAAAYVVSSIFYARLFAKAGVEGKWRAWVPVYREMVFAKLGDLNPWWFLILLGAAFVLNLIPYVGALIGWIPSIAAAVYLVLAAYRVGQKLQKEGAWVVLYVFLSIVWLGIVAFDKSRWNPNIARAAWAGNFLADTTVWQGIPTQPGAGPVPGYGAPGAPGYGAPGYTPPAAPGYAPPPAAPGAYPPPAPGYAPPPAAPGAYPPPAAPGASPAPGDDAPPAPPAPPSDPNAPRV